MKTISTQEFRDEIYKLLTLAKAHKNSHFTINSGELHRSLGKYPGPNHSMPSCCNAMRSIQGYKMIEIDSPEKGNGASLTITYIL